MSIKLFFEAIIKYLLGVLVVGLLIFLPGSFSYWQGWLFMGVLFIPMFLGGIVLMIWNPDLLRRRLNDKEKEKEQKVIISLIALMFIFGFVIAGFNYHFKWLVLPDVVSYIFSVVFLLSYLLYAEVLRENAYLLRTIEVENNQKVVDTGLYKIVRHPMYTITIFLFLSIPLILGSIISFVIFLAYPFIIAGRIKNEEKVLEKDLKGYKEYEKKVKYRLIPFIW